MNKVQNQKSIFQEIKCRYLSDQKRRKRKKSIIRAKLILTIFLPAFIFILAIKAASTFIRIKIRELFAGPLNTRPADDSVSAIPAEPVPVKMIPAEKEILKPEPVSTNL